MADDYEIKDIYQGGYDSLNPFPNLSPSNYPVQAGSLALTTLPTTANQVKEVSAKLSSGVKQIELALISPEIFDSIPQQHLKEINRVSKLTGAEISVHGPVMDSTGITQQGFSELNRKDAERRFTQTIERSHEIDPKGNILVNFHSAEGIPGTEYEVTPDGKKKMKKLIIVNRETGKIAPIEEEEKYDPRLEGLEKKRSFKQELKDLNATEWDNSLSAAIFNQENAEKILENIYPYVREIYPAIMKNPELVESLPQQSKDILARAQNAQEYINQAEITANSLFNRAYKYGTKEQQEKLKKLAKEYRKVSGIKKEGQEYSSEEIIKVHDPKNKSRTVNLLLGGLQNIVPDMYIPIEKFAVEQSAKTFGNTAFNSYKKFKDNAPIVTIENPPAGFAISTGEDLRNLIKESRKQFVESAIKPKNDGGLNLSEAAAKKQAEKLIGATWDVGHINMIRKQGLGEKEILEESKKIAPFVKHVHLSDNFGFEHTELPMGMGNVPTKEIMKRLGKKGFEAKKVIEAAQWWQHFSPQGQPQESPLNPTLAAFGTPMYSTGEGPYWNQAVGFQQDYLGGYGNINPGIHHQTFGAGFSQLPMELGGQMPGAQGSRVSGNPME
ncbi:MAG: TIM barrel protein [Candidatus Pacearchaeota archaeon]|nr:TIM barrel protein [Candidatus Pacearchaeota archaeon]